MKIFIFITMLVLTSSYASDFRECDIKNEQLSENMNLTGKFWDNKVFHRYSQFADRTMNITLYLLDNCKDYYKKSITNKKNLNNHYKMIKETTNTYYKNKAISQMTRNKVISKIDRILN